MKKQKHIKMSGRPSSPTTTQLEFTQAMTDFKIMFPSMDVDVIEAVLRSNNGAVDTTIDQLLSMSADNETGNDNKNSASPPPDYPNTLPSYKEAIDLNPNKVADILGASSISDTGQPDLLSDLASLGASGGNTSVAVKPGEQTPLHTIKNWVPPLLGRLPSDFLRIKAPPKHGHSYTHPDRPANPQHMSLSQTQLRERMNENQRRLVTASQGPDGQDKSQQMLEDEKFALMLQNEEFMTELRGNHEFLSTLEEDHDHTHHTEHPSEKPREMGSRKTHLGMDDALFREKLKNMGKTSKQKFAKLATMFSRQRGAGRVLGHAPAPSKDNLLLNADPLVNCRDDSDTQDSDDEQHSTTKGRKYQLM